MQCAASDFTRCVAIAAAWGLIAASPSAAESDVWKTAANGSWSAGLSWVDGTSPDSASDQATIARAGAYTVSFVSNPPSIGALTLSSSANVTFASTIKPPNPVPVRSLSIVKSGGQSGNLVVNNGATLTMGSATGADPPSQSFNLTAEGSLQVDSTSSLNVAFGSVLTSSGATNSLNGIINVNVGSMNLAGAATIGGTGSDGVVTVSGSGSRLVSSNQLLLRATENAHGALFVTGGGLVECLGAGVGGSDDTFVPASAAVTVTGSGSHWKVTNNLDIGNGDPGSTSGTVSIQSGGFVSVGQGTVVSRRGSLLLQGGVFETGEFRAMEFGFFNWTAGTFRVGTHHGNLFNQSGTLSPGRSAGVTTVVGDYTQQSGGTMEIEIGGVAQGTLFDFVNVTEDAQFGGRLDLKLLNGFVPSPGQNFTILTADAIVGSFSNVTSGERLATSSGEGSFLVHYGVGSPFNPNQVVLSSFQTGGLSGDFDADGDVDGRDFLVWQRGGSPNANSPADLAVWKTNFGRTSAMAASHAVPEPQSTVLILNLAAAAIVSAARCRSTARVARASSV